MAIGITASQLKAAGFDDESILGHIDEQRPLLKQAGFSDNQIDKFYGIERTTVAPLTDGDVHPLHQSVNTEGESLNAGQDVSKTWAEKQAEKNPSSANASNKVNNSSITDENKPIKEGDSVNFSANKAITSTDQIINNKSSLVPFQNVPTPDYNTQLFQTIAEQQAAKEKTEAEMKEKGLIYYDQLSDSERKIYNRNRKKPVRDGQQMGVIYRPTEDAKIPILNTTVTTGPSSMLVLNSIKNAQSLEDDDVGTLNEFVSFIASIESGNRNIYNEAGTKGGVFQLSNEEMPSLLNYYGNVAKASNPDWKMPKWMELAYTHKDPTKLSLDAQRALALIKISMNPEAQAYILKGARGDKDALTALYTDYYNPAPKTEFVVDQKKLAAWEAKNEDFLKRSDNQTAIAKSLLDQIDNNIGDVEKAKESLAYQEELLKGLKKENEALEAEYKEITGANFVPQKGRDETIFKERVNSFMGSWNTLNYEYSLPELATWSSSNLRPEDDDWWITKYIKDSSVGKKFIKYTGGAGDRNVFGAGYQLSTLGLIEAYHTAVTVDDIDPQQAYEQIFMHQAQNFPQEIVQSAVTLVNDLPVMGLGFVGGLGIGAGTTAATGGAAAPATPFIAMGTAFGLPETIRDVYMRAMMNGEVNDFDELLDEIMRVQTLKTFGKYTTVGAATYGTGKYIKGLGGGRKTQIAGEVATMVTLSSVLEGQVPTRKDFAHAAVLIFGIHYAGSGINKLYHIYKTYGIHPRDMQTLAEKRDDVKADLLDPDVQEPRALGELNEAFIKGLEEEANIKLIEAPKVELEAKVAVEGSGSREGIVKAREEINGEIILKVELENGEVVHVKEIDIQTAPKAGTEQVTVGKDGKIEITERVETNFKERQQNGEYNTDIVELQVPKEQLSIKWKESPEEIKVLDSTMETYVGEGSGGFTAFGRVEGNTKYVIDTTAFGKTFDSGYKARAPLRESRDGSPDVVIGEWVSQHAPKAKETGSRVDVVYEVTKDGPSGVKADSYILRDNQGGMFAIPKAIYEAIQQTKYIKSVDYKGVTDYKTPEKTQILLSGDVLMVLDQKTRRVVAAFKTEKLKGQPEQQATNYYNTHVGAKDKVFAESDVKGGAAEERVYSSKGGEEWGVPNEPSTGGGAEVPPNMPLLNSPYKKFYNNAKGLDTFDLVELVEILINKTPAVEKLGPTLRGYFQFGKKGKQMPIPKEELKVIVNRALAENPKDFTMTLAHEIGHLIDYLPQETMKKGNILGSMAALKGYLNKWIDGKADGAKPLERKEIEAMKREAEIEAAKFEKKVDKEITEDLKITPQKILDIFRDPDIRNKIDPEFYEAFAKLDGKLKKMITRSAMRGMIDPHIKALVDRINGKKPSTEAEGKLSEEAAEIFKRKFETEIRERGLVSREEITTELKALSQQWKPFDRAADPKYTAYRDNPRELMADFMMAFLLRPQWTMVNAPKSWQLFNYHMYKRPEVKAQYEKLQNQINAGSDARYSAMVTRIANKFVDSKTQIFKGMEEAWKPNSRDAIEIDLLDTMAWFYRRFGGQNGMWGKNKTGQSRWMDKETLNLNARMENYRYRHAGMQRYAETMDAEVVRPIEAAGYNSSMLSAMLLLRNLAVSQQRMGKANPMGLWSQLKAIGKEGEAIMNEFVGERTPLEAYQWFAKEHPLLDQAATKFYEIRKRYLHPLIKESGAFDKETLNKILNNEEYITFNVLKYALDRLNRSGGQNISSASFSKKAEGTLSDIVDPLLATLQKDLLIMGELKRNRMIHDAIQWMGKNKDWIESFDAEKMAKEVGGQWKDKVVQKAKYVDKGRVEPAPVGMKTVAYMRNGKYVYYHINKFAAVAFERNPHVAMQWMKYVQSSNNFFRTIYTEYNPKFWQKNTFRDIGRAVRNLPKARYFDIAGGFKNSYVKYFFMNLKPTWKSIFGDRKGTELTRWMEEQGFLIAQVEGYRGKAGEAHIQKLLDNKTITPDQYVTEKMMQRLTPKEYESLYDRTMGRFFQHISDFAKFLERAPKVAGAAYLRDMIARGEISMSTQEMMLKIQADVGSPAFLRTARYHQLTNNMLIFSNAMKEGIRADYVRLREDPLSVTGKFVAYNVAPKVLQKMMKYGVFGSGLYWFYKGVSEYDEQNYIVIPIAYTKEGRPVYWRIPQDESARVMNGFIGLFMDATFGEGEIGPSNFLKALESDVLPSMNPIFPFLKDTITFATGGNPLDNFRGEYALNEDVWNAQNSETTKEALKYMWNTYGGGSIYRLRSDDPTEIVSELEEILRIPLAGEMANVFLKVGEHPVKMDIYKDLKLLDREKSRENLIFRGAIKKILDASDEKLTTEEITVIAKRKNYIKNNTLLRKQIGKVSGGTDLLQLLLSETDRKKQALIIKNIQNFVQENPKDFPLLFSGE